MSNIIKIDNEDASLMKLLSLYTYQEITTPLIAVKL